MAPGIAGPTEAAVAAVGSAVPTGLAIAMTLSGGRVRQRHEADTDRQGEQTGGQGRSEARRICHVHCLLMNGTGIVSSCPQARRAPLNCT